MPNSRPMLPRIAYKGTLILIFFTVHQDVITECRYGDVVSGADKVLHAGGC